MCGGRFILRAALNDFINYWSDDNGILVEFHSAQKEKRLLDPETNIHVYRIVQEALNNVLNTPGRKVLR